MMESLIHIALTELDWTGLDWMDWTGLD